MISSVVLTLFATLIQLSSAQDGPEGCVAASCTTYTQVNTLYCHPNPARFCQCRPAPSGGGWTLQVMPCPEPETVFSFRQQVCVHSEHWDGDAECLQGTEEGSSEDLLLDSGLCEQVSCRTYEELNTLSCHGQNLKLFCQCKPIRNNPSEYAAVVMPCTPGTSFSYYHQTCSRDQLWFNSCPN